MEVDIDGSFYYAETESNAKDNAEKNSRPKALKTEEERLLRAFYEFKIQDVCDAFMFPRKIQATALIYFKRFYLQWSVMEHYPKNIMLTCIYAACKTEENHVSAEELGKGIEQDHQMILHNEMLVLQTLAFDIIVYAPYRALEGFVNDIEEFSYGKMQHREMLKNVHDSAKVEVDKIMGTDAPLLFPPGQIQKLETPTSKDVRHIDRKLRSCLDPSSHDKSKKRKDRYEGNSPMLDALSIQDMST